MNLRYTTSGKIWFSKKRYSKIQGKKYRVWIVRSEYAHFGEADEDPRMRLALLAPPS